MAAILDCMQSEGFQGSDIMLVEFLSVENMGLRFYDKSNAATVILLLGESLGGP